LFVFAGFMVLGLISNVVMALRPAPTPAEIAAAAKEKKAHDEEAANEAARSNRALTAKLGLMASLRNPASLELDDVRASKNGDLVCIEYRAQNGFGGMNQEFFALDAAGHSHRTVDYWNKHCTQWLFDVKQPT
jgi:hypothetical protein